MAPSTDLTVSRSALGLHAPVELIGVGRSFGAREVLRRVDLRVERGEIHALLGANGAGKTTLLRILVGLVDPDRGEARVLGGRPTDRAARQRVGWIPAGDRSFYQRLSGLENLVFFGRLHGMGRREVRRRGAQLMEEVGLAEAAGVRVAKYSQGMKKRLALARALMAEPAVLLLDETTHDLDPVGARQACATVRRAAAGGAAVVWASQRLEEVRRLAHTVTVLSGGRPGFTGSMAELLAHADGRLYVVRLAAPSGAEVGAAVDRALGAMSRSAALPEAQAGEWVIELGDEVVLGAAIAALTDAGLPVLGCREALSDVEEAFVNLTAPVAAG